MYFFFLFGCSFFGCFLLFLLGFYLFRVFWGTFVFVCFLVYVFVSLVFWLLLLFCFNNSNASFIHVMTYQFYYTSHYRGLHTVKLHKVLQIVCR